MSKRSASTLTGPFVTEAGTKGLKPPVRILEHETHGWIVAERGKESLVLDEYGDLWWARLAGNDAQVSRSCWPEEFHSLHPAVKESIEQILNAPR